MVNTCFCSLFFLLLHQETEICLINYKVNIFHQVRVLSHLSGSAIRNGKSRHDRRYPE